MDRFFAGGGGFYPRFTGYLPTRTPFHCFQKENTQWGNSVVFMPRFEIPIKTSEMSFFSSSFFFYNVIKESLLEGMVWYERNGWRVWGQRLCREARLQSVIGVASVEPLLTQLLGSLGVSTLFTKKSRMTVWPVCVGPFLMNTQQSGKVFLQPFCSGLCITWYIFHCPQICCGDHGHTRGRGHWSQPPQQSDCCQHKDKVKHHSCFNNMAAWSYKTCVLDRRTWRIPQWFILFLFGEINNSKTT